MTNENERVNSIFYWTVNSISISVNISKNVILWHFVIFCVCLLKCSNEHIGLFYFDLRKATKSVMTFLWTRWKYQDLSPFYSLYLAGLCILLLYPSSYRGTLLVTWDNPDIVFLIVCLHTLLIVNYLSKLWAKATITKRPQNMET